MGCGRSKNTGVAEVPLDRLGNESVETFDKAKPKQIITDIDKYYKVYLERRNQLKPLIAERTGLQAFLDEEREKLVELLIKKDSLEKERDPLLLKIWERDADDIYKAFGKFSLDKVTLCNILLNRNKSQIEEIGNVFEKKYGRLLLDFVVNEMTTVIGTILFY